MLVALVGRLPCCSHKPRSFQRLKALDIDLAPDAPLAPRREADGVGILAERFSVAVDPPEAKRLVACLRPVDRRLAAGLLPKADEQLRHRLMIGLEPAAEAGSGLKEDRLRH